MRFVIALLLGGCASSVPFEAGGDAPEAPDAVGPRLRSAPIDAPQRMGVDVLIDAVVDDESGVFDVSVGYRRETAATFTFVALREVGPTEGGVRYQGEIRGEDVKDSGVYYYLTAVDGSPSNNESCLPAPCEGEPWRFNVTP